MKKYTRHTGLILFIRTENSTGQIWGNSENHVSVNIYYDVKITIVTVSYHKRMYFKMFSHGHNLQILHMCAKVFFYFAFTWK